MSDEAAEWLRRLPAKDQRRIGASIGMLRRVGPTLGRPLVDRIAGSRYHHMKELRTSGSNRARYRMLLAFDPNRRAVILLGGDKSNNWKGWYPEQIRTAEQRYERHLRSIGKASSCLTPRTGERSSGRSR